MCCIAWDRGDREEEEEGEDVLEDVEQGLVRSAVHGWRQVPEDGDGQWLVRETRGSKKSKERGVQYDGRRSFVYGEGSVM